MLVAEITARLGQPRTTIYRELAHTRFRDADYVGDRWRDVSGYYPVTAHNCARARRHRLAQLTRWMTIA